MNPTTFCADRWWQVGEGQGVDGDIGMISCFCGDGGGEWYYFPPEEFTQYKRSRRATRCASCGTLVRGGDEVAEFTRGRAPRSDIEEAIYGDEVELASWFYCEECAGVYFSVIEAGYCVVLEKGWDIRKGMNDLMTGKEADEFLSWFDSETGEPK